MGPFLPGIDEGVIHPLGQPQGEPGEGAGRGGERSHGVAGEALPAWIRRIGQGTGRSAGSAAHLRVWKRSDRSTGNERRPAGSEKPSGLLSTLAIR